MLNHFLQDAGISPGWLAVAAAGVAAVAYFLGCFNGSVVVSRYILRDDVRGHGSGNAGLTNFYRTFGGPLTALVILSDVLKAVAAILFGVFIAEHISPSLVILAKYWAGTFCLLGHMYPCTFQFKGGKGVLSGGTIVWLIDWRVGLAAWAAFVLLFLLTRYVSLGSCAAALTFPFTTAYFFQDPLISIFGVMLGALVIWKHRANLARVAHGTESKFTLHKKKPEEPPSELEKLPEEAAREAEKEEREP